MRAFARGQNATSLYRYLFPYKRQRARTRLSDFRHEILPYYRQQAHSRLYQFLITRQRKRQQRKADGTTILGKLGISTLAKRKQLLSRNEAALTARNMTQQGSLYGPENPAQPSERGARRRKFAGYLKAANELRQSYQQSYGWRQNDGSTDEDGSSMPGSFPELTSARHGDEELVLFPSYARRHRPTTKRQPPPAIDRDIRSEQGSGDAEYWRKEWEKHEDSTAIVDVDVRGWVFAPHRGPMSRKNRMLVGLARHLSGIPAPSTSSRDSSPQSAVHRKIEAHASKHEEEAVQRAAEDLKRRGEGEAQIASQGGYKQGRMDGSGDSSGMSPVNSRSPSPDPRPGRASIRSSKGDPYDDEALEPGSLEKRASWSHPSDMSQAELTQANAHLMVRLKPFLTTPLAEQPLTVFFYNDRTSKSRTVTTDESGHFTLRAALDFVPTHVRVLASDKLSATEEVRVIETTGISVISDIDDTIKHSAIGSGAREIFRNTFIRELGDLKIEGVREWYSKMANMGVTFHYVSNSPWQIFPLLMNYFSLAGLPQGSFHLKQYNGMLQGIFEPVAERKKGTLEKIMNDFPERRFILVGDSGEADLELYTDVVLSNPGRVLGVFIRDVTTTVKGFFDSSTSTLRKRGSQSPVRGRLYNGSLWSRKSTPDLRDRPPLPPRRESRATYSDSTSNANHENVGRLIDFDDDEPNPPALHRAATFQPAPKPSPPRPLKPSTFENPSSEPRPPLPTRPSAPPKAPSSRRPAPLPKPQQFSTSTSDNNPNSARQPSPLSQAHPAPTSPPHPRPHRSTSPSEGDRSGYRSLARSKISSAYNALPSLYQTAQVVGASRGPQGSLTEVSSSSTPEKRPPPPVPPPRRNLSSYPIAAAQYASNRISSSWNGTADTNSSATNGYYTHSNGSNGYNDGNGNDATQPLSKKEELWNRRWAKAQEIFRDKGVMLKTWRRGEDIMGDAIRLVEKAAREQQGRGGGKVG